MLLRSQIGPSLRKYRQTSNLTLRDLAVKSGISMSFISEAERGKKEMSSEMLAAICDSMNLSLISLLKDILNSVESENV